MGICWYCNASVYHDYKDKHGIRCPSCGQKEKDDPKSVKFSDDAIITSLEVMQSCVTPEIPKTQVAKRSPVKRTVRSK